MDIDEAWKSTCRAVLGGEVGDLRKYEDYLLRYVGSMDSRKSSISGKPVSIDGTYLGKDARIMGNEELGAYRERIGNFRLNTNKIKDLDSLLEEMNGRSYYVGNIVLGNSRNVVDSSRCEDCQNVYRSYSVFEGKHVAYSCAQRTVEYLFGCNWGGNTKSCISLCDNFMDTRCMECVRTYFSSDCYYMTSSEGCNHCMFSFNLRNRSYCIGNIQLDKDKYAELSKKLIGEIRETLGRSRKAPSMLDIINS